MFPTMSKGKTGDVDVRKFVLVSGASGFIGNFVCENLVKQGYNVVKLDVEMWNPPVT